MTTIEDRSAALVPTRDEPVGPGVGSAAAPRRRRVLGGVHPAWIIVFGSGALLVRAVVESGLSNDTYWQWTAGRWMLAHHAVMRVDVFSYTVAGRRWLDEEWGFQLLLAWLVRTIGPVAFWVVSAGATVAALLASVARWRLQRAPMLRIAALSALAAGFLLLGDSARPQTFSYLFFALELLALERARRHRVWLVTLPALFVLWANMHGSFLAGLVLLALELGLALFVARRPIRRALVRVSRPLPTRAVALTLAGSLAACCCNPNGPRLIAYAFHLTTDSELASLIEEWQSPNFHSLVLLGLVVAPTGVALCAVLRRRSLEGLDLLLTAGLLLAGLHAQRFLPYFGLAVAGLLAGVAPVRVDRFRPSVATLPLACALAVVLVAAGPHTPAGAPQRNGPAAVPVAAATWIDARPGRVFSTYAWNDYLIERGIRVFVDGRTDLYFGTGILESYERVNTLGVDPDPVLARWHVRYVLWPTDSALAVFLSHDPAWHVAWRSRGSVVFARASGLASRG